MTAFTDAELYDRGTETLLASWIAYTAGSAGALLHRAPGVAAGVFPAEPERGIYNNAVLARGLPGDERESAIETMEGLYAAAGIEHFAAWVHERDAGTVAALERRGYIFDSSTRAMGMNLTELTVPLPELELGALDWHGYLRLFDLPLDLIATADHAAFNLVTARWNGADVAAALAFDGDGDCGIFNVETVERARRRGIGTALTALQLHRARGRGCLTASLQSTPMAERVYAASGFRDLGRILEYVPPMRPAAAQSD
jgi:GNAT superfamily N-acetyltransferase